jgi:hypothetical protein
LRIANDIIRFCAIVIGLGLIFAWLGVYNTGWLPFYQRFIFWSSTMAVGAGASVLIAPLIWGPRFEQVPAIFKIGIASALISIPVTLTLLLFFSIDPWSPSKYLMQYAYVLVISLIITTGAYVWDVLKAQNAPVEGASDPVASFLERLPVKFRTADLHAISSEDHYLRVHTSCRSTSPSVLVGRKIGRHRRKTCRWPQPARPALWHRSSSVSLLSQQGERRRPDPLSPGSAQALYSKHA